MRKAFRPTHVLSETGGSVDPACALPTSRAPQKHRRELRSAPYSSELDSYVQRANPALLHQNVEPELSRAPTAHSPSLPLTSCTQTTRTAHALSRTDTLRTHSQTEVAEQASAKSSPFDFVRTKLRHHNSIYDGIMSPTEDAGNIFSAATSDCDFRGRGTPYSGGYSPESAAWTRESRQPHNGKQARSVNAYHSKTRKSRPQVDFLRPDPKRRKQDALRRDLRERQKSAIFIDVSDVVQDFIWEQKFKADCALSQGVNPKFFTLDFSTDHFAYHQPSSTLRNTDDIIVQDSWAVSSLLDPINDTEAVHVDKDDGILDSAPLLGKVDEAEKEKELLAVGDKEALFLRRTLLISNDLYTDGLTFKHGIEGAEKALIRNVPATLEVNEVAKRIDATFELVKTRVQHPSRPGLKIKRVMPLLPNRDLWIHPYTQVKYDEPPTMPELLKVPPVLVKATVSPYITAFAVYQYGDEEQAHVIDRSYMWDNQGECSIAQDAEFRLLEWPTFCSKEDNASRPVLFSQVSNKIRLRKLTARVPKQRKIYETELFGSKAINIEWRNPTNEDADREAEVAKYMFE